MILITGSGGFIGGHIMRHLSQLDYDVHAMNTADLKAENFYQLDEADVLIHCAWPTRTDLHATDHLEFAELTCHLFEQCSKKGVRVINLGSSSEYGPKNEPMREDMICEPINTYGIAKLAVTLFAKKQGFNTLRLFTISGDGGHGFSDHVAKAKKYSSPTFTRSLSSVLGVCMAIERLVHARHIYGEIFNMPATNYTYEEMADLAKGKGTWDSYPQKQFEPRDWECNATKFQDAFAL